MLLKRVVDLLLSGAILILMSPVLAAVALAILFESGRPILFSQVRVGRHLRNFRILKFRTMVVESNGPSITVGGDRRITRIGRILRKTKLDELPQFWNVIRGDMSIVGPRPEVPEYVHLFRERYERILALRPGITDYASIYFRNEEELLSRCSDPLQEYRDRVLPAKLDLAEKYLRERSLMVDLKIILQSARVAFGPASISGSSGASRHETAGAEESRGDFPKRTMVG